MCSILEKICVEIDFVKSFSLFYIFLPLKLYFKNNKKYFIFVYIIIDIWNRMCWNIETSPLFLKKKSSKQEAMMLV